MALRSGVHCKEQISCPQGYLNLQGKLHRYGQQNGDKPKSIIRSRNESWLHCQLLTLQANMQTKHSPRLQLPANRSHGLLSLLIETIIVIICFSLSLASLPEHIRKSLWAAGAEKGWNSNPHDRLYFYANYKTPPPVPFIWNQKWVVVVSSTPFSSFVEGVAEVPKARKK